jgi:tRNA threonylcarbamoyladenosine biosynthesis protein TsaE
MEKVGAQIGALLRGGEVIELVGDVGAGKTTFAKGLARGMKISEDIQSPTFTISRVYTAGTGLTLAHYDFYRLVDAGIMSAELHESITDPETVTVIEWAGIVMGVLPRERLTLTLASPTELSRTMVITASGARYEEIERQLG